MFLIKNSWKTRARIMLATAILATVPGWALAGQGGIQPEAQKLLKNSLDYLASLQKFGLETHSTIEVVLESGQKLQFDHDIAATVQRPNKLHAKRLGELADDEFFYDGRNLTLHYPGAGFYATVKAPDTLEGMLDFAMQSLDIVAPAGDFLYPDAYEMMMADVRSGFVVGMPAFIEGVVCDHLAFSAPGTDIQIWVEQGERHLPRKLIITSTDIVNAPQYTVNISSWDLAPEVSDETFNFDAPEDSAEIEFIMLTDDTQ